MFEYNLFLKILELEHKWVKIILNLSQAWVVFLSNLTILSNAPIPELWMHICHFDISFLYSLFLKPYSPKPICILLWLLSLISRSYLKILNHFCPVFNQLFLRKCQKVEGSQATTSTGPWMKLSGTTSVKIQAVPKLHWSYFQLTSEGVPSIIHNWYVQHSYVQLQT